MLTALTLTLLAQTGASVELQPGSAHPGEAVLIVVRGSTREPSGSLGGDPLDFFDYHGTYLALASVRVDQVEGALPLTVRLVTQGREQDVGGQLDVLPPDFRHRTLTVAPRFISPSKAQQRQMKEDQRAFDEAFDQDRVGPMFDDDFEWPRPAEVTAPFGDIRLYNGKKTNQHFGTDIDGSTGDPIFASNEGEVVMQRPCYGSGNTVVLFHGLGLFTAYFHLSRFDVKVGDHVDQGQRLGLVGMTGRVTGPHLHFGAKIRGRWVNAESVLRLHFPPGTAPSETPSLTPGL